MLNHSSSALKDWRSYSQQDGGLERVGVGGRSCWEHSVGSLKEKILHDVCCCFSVGDGRTRRGTSTEGSQWLEHQE